VEQPCDEFVQIESYKRYVISLIEKFTTTSIDLTPLDDSQPWADPAAVHERIGTWARNLGVMPPATAQWAMLTPLQRFALFKLTRSGHSNGNFIPAMREFSIQG
jgi:hypothetical protein